MRLFRFFKSKKQQPNAQSSKVPVHIEFTKEETEYIARNRTIFAGFAERDGKVLWVTDKVANVINAIGLLEYVEELVSQVQAGAVPTRDSSFILAKAIKAQVKVYALHDLPYYLFVWAQLSEMVGDTEAANRLYSLFVKAESDFSPDKADATALDYLTSNGHEVASAFDVAKSRLSSGND